MIVPRSLVTQATKGREANQSRQTGWQKEPEGSCPEGIIKVNELALTFEQDRDENEWREVEISSCQSIESDPRQIEGLGSRPVTTLSRGAESTPLGDLLSRYSGKMLRKSRGRVDAILDLRGTRFQVDGPNKSNFNSEGGTVPTLLLLCQFASSEQSAR